VEWCPDPFQLPAKQTGDVTEPEMWESDSGGGYSEGYGRTSSVSSADNHRKQGHSLSLSLSISLSLCLIDNI